MSDDALPTLGELEEAIKREQDKIADLSKVIEARNRAAKILSLAADAVQKMSAGALIAQGVPVVIAEAVTKIVRQAVDKAIEQVGTEQ